MGDGRWAADADEPAGVTGSRGRSRAGGDGVRAEEDDDDDDGEEAAAAKEEAKHERKEEGRVAELLDAFPCPPPPPDPNPTPRAGELGPSPEAECCDCHRNGNRHACVMW